jgi:hypothetical protein
MAVVHDTFTVGTTATLIATIPAGNPTTTVAVVNDDNSSIFIGDNTLSVSGANKGLTVVKNTNYRIDLNAGDQLYAISSAGTANHAVTVLYSKVTG